MKAKYLLQTIVFFSVFFVLAAARGAERDYWPTNDWRSSPPEQQGMNSKVLEKINDYAGEKKQQMGGVLVVRHGYIVFEEYYSGSKEDLRTLYSVTKSVISALIGIALEEGYLKNIDQKMIDFFPEYVSTDLNPEVDKVTIRRLLTMSAGFGRDIGTGITKPAWIKDRLNKPLKNEPGKMFSYDSTNSNILSMIITKTTGLEALDFGKKYLFGPLGISNLKWEGMYGYTYGGFGLQLTARDMAKIGYLFLNGGRWGETQVLAPEWVAESIRVQIEVPTSDTLKTLNADYGFHWWVFSTGAHPSYTAWGFGGQFIHVMPDLDIVTVITTYGATLGSQHLLIIENFVVPSVQN
jgi:CubicO group peptidase (beta-lactamase class C family)